MNVLDLFSAAAGGWSLGLHRAGFRTMAACEAVGWRRALFAENNPGIVIYDDVCTLTGDRVLADHGYLPDIIAGSPPCQDISSANTTGKGVDGHRSGLYFEAIRIIAEVQRLGRVRGTGGARWFALENSANLRTRGADRVLSSLEAFGYTCWAFVVGGDDIGANHERKRSWLIGCDLAQLADTGHSIQHGRNAVGRWSGRPQGSERVGPLGSSLRSPDKAEDERSAFDPSGRHDPFHSARVRYASGGPRRHRADGNGSTSAPESAGIVANAHQARQANGPLVPGLRQAEISNNGRRLGWRADRPGVGQMGLRPGDRRAALQHRADWSLDDLARHIRLDDGLPAWLAEQRIAVGGPRGTSAASLVVEAFGDAVLPQIPEAIGRAILTVEAAFQTESELRAA